MENFVRANVAYPTIVTRNRRRSRPCLLGYQVSYRSLYPIVGYYEEESSLSLAYFGLIVHSTFDSYADGVWPSAPRQQMYEIRFMA